MRNWLFQPSQIPFRCTALLRQPASTAFVFLGGDGFPSTTSANNLIAKRQLATPPVYEQEVVRCAKTSPSASLSPNSSNSTRTIAACHIAYLACGNLKCVLLLRVEPFCTCEAEQKKEDEDCYLNFHFKIYYHENQILFFGSC